MKTIKWIIGIVIALLIITCIIYSKMQGIPVQAKKITKGTISEYIEERAVTTLSDLHKITMPLSGRIKPIHLAPGTSVKKGQIIAQLDKEDLQTAATEVKARINAIKGQITLGKYNALETTALIQAAKGLMIMEDLIKVSEEKVLANKSIYKFAEEYEKSLSDSGEAISRIKKEKAKKNVAVKKTDLGTAKIMHNVFNIMHSISKLAPAYINEYINSKKLHGHILASRLAEAQAALKEAELNLKRCDIKSPIDGIVLNKYISNLRFLPAGTLLMELGNLDQLQITSNILSEEAVNINTENAVDIFGAAIGVIPIQGKVIRVDPKGFTKLSSLGVEQQRVHVKIAFNKDSLKTLKKAKKHLGDKFRLQVKVYTASKNNVLKAPRTALFKGNNGGWKVYVIKDDKAMIQDITVGLINDNEAEILKGLSEGDEVILAPSNTLTDRARVSY